METLYNYELIVKLKSKAEAKKDIDFWSYLTVYHGWSHGSVEGIVKMNVFGLRIQAVHR